MLRKSSPKNQPMHRVERAVKAFAKKSSVSHDPGGSYTGRPREKGDRPTQDADDL